MSNPTAEQADQIHENNAAQFNFRTGFDFIQRCVNANARDKGFWDNPRNDGECIALMHSELSEALEAIRKPALTGHIEESHNLLEEELADTIIRIMDLAQARSLDVSGAVLAKARFNRGRERMHGKSF